MFAIRVGELDDLDAEALVFVPTSSIPIESGRNAMRCFQEGMVHGERARVWMRMACQSWIAVIERNLR